MADTKRTMGTTINTNGRVVNAKPTNSPILTISRNMRNNNNHALFRYQGNREGFSSVKSFFFFSLDTKITSYHRFVPNYNTNSQPL